MAKHYEWNDYYIPGTQVLRNLFTGPGKPYGETDPIKLRSIEESKVRARMLLLQSDPIKGNFDFAHMKAIHGFLFQDVYEWAGQERTAPSFWDSRMSKDGHRYFPAGDPMLEQANRLYRGLASKDYLVGLVQDDFIREYAEFWNEINVVHAFREGNTRSQFVFFSQLAEHAGYELHSDAFAVGEPLRDAFVEARYVGQDTGRSDRLAEVLGQAITPLGGGQIEDVDPDALNAARLSSLSVASVEARYSRGGPDVSSRGGGVGPSVSKDDGLSF
ncbi:Fic/DOC family protein [Rothia mucilaginosa]|uniref:Fic/DOC family protein n=1 Tax=Rothia mucilaginosa TaxID=43675 RepID=UPI003C72E89A